MLFPLEISINDNPFGIVPLRAGRRAGRAGFEERSGARLSD